MATHLPGSSPSRTVTFAAYTRLPEEARLSRLRRVAAENLETTLRILRYNVAYHIHLYRVTSRLVPLATHPLLTGWDYRADLAAELSALGDYAIRHDLRLSAHPDHFTVLNSVREEVFQAAVTDLDYHVSLFEGMGLDERAKLILHVGGGGAGARERFAANFRRLPERLQRRLVLENDDRVYTASEVLGLANDLGLPVCLDLHHQRVNQGAGEDLRRLVASAFTTWRDYPPKVHVSSPRSEREPRSHADFVSAADLAGFLAALRELSPAPPVVDLMVEAKQKDKALFRLVDELSTLPGVRRLDEANLELEGGS
jgi:UV DNA damage endonuclease